ncbi:MAG: CHAT domain-containing protein [Planctomycetota bacterium]|nr:CHAT domain-containing protein [Planctomycetota bacterium]
MTTMTAGIDSKYRRSRQTLCNFGRFALLIVPFLSLPQALQAQFNPQQARTQSIIKPVYFASLELLQRGRYKQAIKGFQQASRNAIRSGSQRWIDSICYYTMLGETFYRTGQLEEARNNFESALNIYLQSSDWMLRMKFPPQITPKNNSRGPSWARSRRKFILGNFPDVFPILRGGKQLVTGNGKSGIANVQKLQSLHATEVVRCTALAIRRYTELYGPLAEYNPLLEKVQSSLVKRQTAPNHWSQAWIDFPLGVAQAALGKKEVAAATLQRSLVINGRLDHPLTGAALLELGRLSLNESRYDQATNFFQAAALSAAYYNQQLVVQEAFNLAFVAHAASGRGGVPPNFADAIIWAKRNNLDETYASLLIRTAEGFANSGNIKEAESTLNRVQPVLRRNKIAGSRIGAEANYVAFVIAMIRGDIQSAGRALADAMQFEKQGSIRLFHVLLVDRSYQQGIIRDRIAMQLFAEVLGEPNAIVWRHEPLEAWSQLLIPQFVALEHWFNAAIKREKPLEAIEIADRVRTARFYSTQPLGGRLLNLRWVMQADAAALPQTATLQRQEFLTAYPRFGKLIQQANAIRGEIKQNQLLPEALKLGKQQDKLIGEYLKIAREQEKILRQMVVRREPVEMVFPPSGKSKDIQSRLGAGEAILMLHVASQAHYGFLVTKANQRVWRIESPRDAEENLKDLLRAMGHHEANSAVKLSNIQENRWRQPAKQLLQSLTQGAKIDLSKNITDLTIVPDHFYWYVPFEALPLGSEDAETLLSGIRIRYAPTLGLTQGDGRGRKQSGDWAIVQGQLYPSEDSVIAQEVTKGIEKLVPKTSIISQSFKMHGHAFVSLLDGLLVWDDLDNGSTTPLELAPLQIDRGKEGSTIQDWLATPWPGPDVILLPGFHTPSENSLKKMNVKGMNRAGDELFLTSMGLLGAGSRTLLLSRWRTGGRVAADLLKEFIQELPNTSAADAWQRAVQIVDQTDLDQDSEPRVDSDVDSPQVTGGHPFFWSGFVLIDPGDQANSPGDEPPGDFAFPDGGGDER